MSEKFCQICRHASDVGTGHEENCPVLTGQPQRGINPHPQDLLYGTPVDEQFKGFNAQAAQQQLQGGMLGQQPGALERKRDVLINAAFDAYMEVVRLKARIKESEKLLQAALASDAEQRELILELALALGGSMREADAYTPAREALLARAMKATKPK
jgi:hypothetical protein